MSNYNQVKQLLKELKLPGLLESLDDLTNQAETQSIGHLNWLSMLLNAEVQYKVKKKLERNLTGAHFPIKKYLDDYKYGLCKGYTKSDSENLKDLRWLDNRENILFFGPPGIGKTHLAIGLGMEAVHQGYSVCFERVSNLFKHLKSAQIQRKSAFRIKRIMKCNLLIIDEIGYTPIERKEANLFFNLISELYENSSIIITSNKSFKDWAEMMGDEIMTTAMLDRLLHHSKVFNMDGKSYRLNRKEK